jgi:hypothetical protein
MRDSIYFVYSAEKCFHLARRLSAASRGCRHVKTPDEGQGWAKANETPTKTSERFPLATKALNSTMRPPRRADNSRAFGVNNDSADLPSMLVFRSSPFTLA